MKDWLVSESRQSDREGDEAPRSGQESGKASAARLDVWFPLLAVVVALAVYARVAGLEILLGWDDELYLLRRVEVVDWFSATWRERLLTPELGYPVPLPTFLHYLLMQLPDGMRLPGAHLTNLGFHAANVALVYWLAREWIGGRVAALAVAGVWSVHPLLVESVAWLTDLKQVAFGTFVLGALAVWQLHLEEPRTWTAVGAVVLVIAAFGCRPDAVVMGPAMAAQTWLVGKQSYWQPRIWGPLAVIVGMALVYLPVAFLGHSTAVEAWSQPGSTDLAVGERLVRILAALALQLQHVVWPFGLEPYYVADYGWHSPRVWIGGVLYVVFVAATIVAVRRRSSMTCGWLVWWAFWLPASGIAYLPRFTADTYMYLPLIGLVVVVVDLLRGPVDSAPRPAQIGVGLAVVAGVVGLGVRSVDQIGRWQNTATLYEPVTDKHPDDDRPHLIVAWYYYNSGQWKEAREAVENGLDAMYARGTIPLGLLKVFERTGDPRKGARIALEMYRPAYPGTPSAEVGQYLIWLIARHRLDISREPGIRRVVRTQAGEAMGYVERNWHPRMLQQAAEHFLDERLPDLAALYITASLRKAPKRCEAWSLLDRSRRAVAGPGGEPLEGIDDELPDRPARCRD